MDLESEKTVQKFKIYPFFIKNPSVILKLLEQYFKSHVLA